MSHRTKSGQQQTRHKVHQRWKRRMKRKKEALIAQGVVKKGQPPGPRQIISE